MAVNVRVEARRMAPHARYEDGMRSVTNLLRALKKEMSQSGTNKSIREHQFFVRACDIRRRKKMAKILAPLEAEKKAQEELNYIKNKDKKDKKESPAKGRR